MSETQEKINTTFEDLDKLAELIAAKILAKNIQDKEILPQSDS